MAKIFYYDSVGLLDLSSGSVTAGAYSSGNFSVSAGNVQMNTTLMINHYLIL